MSAVRAAISIPGTSRTIRLTDHVIARWFERFPADSNPLDALRRVVWLPGQPAERHGSRAHSKRAKLVFFEKTRETFAYDPETEAVFVFGPAGEKDGSLVAITVYPA